MAIDVRRSRTPVRRLGRAGAFRVVALVQGLAMLASGLPSPLYGIYQEQWGFSTLTLTLVFAVYCLGVLSALLLAGRLSDQIGRRPVLLAALGGLIVATLLFLAAQSVAWLLLARTLQGVATGAALAAAGAAMLDFHAAGDAEHAGFVNGLVSGAGMASGVLLSAALAQYAFAPLVLPFAVLLLLFCLVLVAVIALPEPVERVARPRVRFARPRVPHEMRGAFLLASLGVMASWSVMGVVLALGPKLSAQVLDTQNHLASGIMVFVMVAAGTLASLPARRAEVRRATAGGSLVLGLGMLMTAASLSTGSAALFVGGAAIVGTGFGFAFLGALRSLTHAVPEHHRAEVMAAFYLVAYGANALPALAAGFAIADLHLYPTFRVFAAAVALVAIGAAIAARTTRPAPAPEPSAA
jgi:MFS family permease